jgi:hypothetical protein
MRISKHTAVTEIYVHTILKGRARMYCLLLLEYWNSGLESHSGRGCVSLFYVFVVLC